uniref:DNA-(apurinic or apyrimidinic site) lyase n=1 Tax=uncultured Armatimonadetes bacterium TaxID=157466 RepID=A0A6J4JF21_9BACT|nr:hypothetical protein AVDCRST_MAG63-3127 [uncultured Armatimonadetes bacterium]
MAVLFRLSRRSYRGSGAKPGKSAAWYNARVESGCVAGLSREDLDLAATLTSGQVFRWTRAEDESWIGTVGGRRAKLRQADDGRLWWEADGPDGGAFIRSFLRLDDVDFPALAEGWCARDAHFAEAWARQPGVRVLRQDPAECFFSFLCASVAPIARISGMLRGVASAYGQPLGCVGGVTLWAFPTTTQLAEADEEALRALGLGFRARRVEEAAGVLAELPPETLSALRGRPHADAKRELMRFFGVGEKIADCVALFSLDQDDAIPVDTHVWRMACAWYTPELRGKSLTPAAYARVGEAFRDRFGPFAGWAQQTLFYRAAVLRARA